MHPRLSVHTAGYGAVAAPEVIRDMAGVGITRLGMTVSQIEAGTLRATAAAAKHEGVELLDVTCPSAFDLASTAGWESGRDRLERAVDMAAMLEAPILYVTTGPAAGLTWDEAAGRFTDAIAPVLEYARSVSVRLAVENTMTLRADLGFVHTLRDALDLAQRGGIGVVGDLFVAWTDRDLEAVLRTCANRFAYVQVGDFVLGTLSSPGRAVPGDGDIPISRHFSWLREAGYTGMVELEILGPLIDREGIAQACSRGLRVVADWL